MESEKSVGTILKEARLAKGLSIADAEQATSVRARYLEAVENDEYEKTPGEVFLKGIIRNYGNYLGLDGLELVKLYKANHQGVAAENINSAGIREVEKVRLNIQLKEKRDIGSGTGRFEMPQLPMKQIAAGLAVVVLLGIGYVAVPKVIDYFKNMPQVEQKQEEVQANASTAVKPPSILDKVQVEMEAKDSCWTEVTADGKEVFVGMLNAKDKRTFEAKDKIVVKYGNIGAMKLIVNGQPVDLKGEHGVAVKTYLRANATSEAPQIAEKAVSEAPVEQEVAGKAGSGTGSTSGCC
ncbi:MAG: helix-turn-helix domain-containing protein [Phascolarctobacterium sp.]